MSDRTLCGVGIAAGVLGIVSSLLFGVALGFDPGAGTSLARRLMTADPAHAEIVRWAAFTDMLGYYLLPLLVAVALRRRLTWSDSLSGDVATVGAPVYGAAGATAAAILAVTAPVLMQKGSSAALADLEMLGTVVEAVWQWLNPVPFMIWMVGITLALRRPPSRMRVVFAVLAIGGALVWAGQLLDTGALLTAGLVLWLAPFPLVMATVGWWLPAVRGRAAENSTQPGT